MKLPLHFNFAPIPDYSRDAQQVGYFITLLPTCAIKRNIKQITAKAGLRKAQEEATPSKTNRRNRRC